MEALADRFNGIVTIDQLADRLWGHKVIDLKHPQISVNQVISRLRKKLKCSGLRIVTIFNTGYRLEYDATRISSSELNLLHRIELDNLETALIGCIKEQINLVRNKLKR